MAPPTGSAGEEGGTNGSAEGRQQQNNNTTDGSSSLNSQRGNAGNNNSNLLNSTSTNLGFNVGSAQPSSSSSRRNVPRRNRNTFASLESISSWSPVPITDGAREQRAVAAEERAAAATARTNNNNTNGGGGNNNPPRSIRNIAVQGPPPLPRAIREVAARNNNNNNNANNNNPPNNNMTPAELLASFATAQDAAVPIGRNNDIPPLSMRDDSSASSNDTSSMQDLIRRNRVAEIRRRNRAANANEVIEIVDSSSDEEAPELVDVGGEDEGPPARSSTGPTSIVTLSNNRAGTTTGRTGTTATATATTGTSTTGGPGGGTGSEDRMPGLRRIMNRLMFQTLAARGHLPPGINSEEDMLDENGETRDPLDLLAMFDDAFTDVNPPTDARKPDQLVCPTCMRVHLPVEGSERIAIPKEEGADNNNADDDAAKRINNNKNLFLEIHL